MTVVSPAIDSRELVANATERLGRAGVDSPRLDAELLLATATGTDRAKIVAGLVEPTADQAAHFETLVARRERREPLAYITGTKGFRRIDLLVDENVLIPRPDTELLVAVAKVDRPCGILDVATGSGAVALALADELPDATIVAADISKQALDTARRNVERLKMGDRVTLKHSDLLDAIDGTFDLITANLPYVTAAEYETLEPEITDFEPKLALVGGDDGLDLVRRLASQAPAALKPGGMLALEIGSEQAVQTEQILKQAGFTETEIHQDLAGHDRVVTGRTQA